MRLPVGESHPEVHDGVAEADPALHLGADAAFDAGDELTGDRAADDLVVELEARTLGEGFDLDVADRILAVATGLLHVPSVSLPRTDEGLAERHDQVALLDADAEPGPQPVEGHVGVRLAHRPQHQLAGLGVVLDAE